MKGFVLDYINENEFKKLERALLNKDYIFSLTTEFRNSDGSISRVYEIRLEEFKYAK